MIERCACGQTQVEVHGAGLILKAENTIAVLTLVNGGQCVKFEHVNCQTCRTITLPRS